MKNKADKTLELLSRLYLRLNGFIVQNILIHSPNKGQSCGELDLVACRFPGHKQEDRGVPSSEYLEISKDRIQLVIGDCKNVGKWEQVEFSPIRKNEECITKLADWLGLTGEEMHLNLTRFLNLHKETKIDGFPRFHYDSDWGKLDIMFVMFCPGLTKWSGKGIKYVDGDEMVRYVWKCLNRIVEVEECSRVYNFENWNEYETMVRYFKGCTVAGTIEDFIKANK